jgi:ankyrin repeat protein
VVLLLAHPRVGSINRTNPLGTTALWWACSEGHANVVRALMESGADPGIAGPNGTTPRAIAQQNRHPDCIAALEVRRSASGAGRGGRG